MVVLDACDAKRILSCSFSNTRLWESTKTTPLDDQGQSQAGRHRDSQPHKSQHLQDANTLIITALVNGLSKSCWILTIQSANVVRDQHC